MVATRFLDNVGLLSLANQFAAAVGISPGNQELDLTIFGLLTLLFAVLVFFGRKVSYFEKQQKYYVGFAVAMYSWLLVFTLLDMNTEYPAGFTILAALGALVGTADYIMEAASPKKKC